MLLIEPKLSQMAKTEDMKELKHELLTASASIKVFAYKMEQFT